MSTKTFDALPSWNDVESSPSFQAAEPKAREQAFALWQKDFVDTALEDPDNVSFEGWTQFKEKSKKKMRELRGASGFLTATEEADDEVASEVPDRLQLASRKRALESKATPFFGNVDTTYLAPEERDELEQLRGSLSAADEDDLDAVEEVANDDREFYVANGQFYASPSLVLAKDRYRQAVKDAPLTVEQKVEALMKGKPLREEVGARLRGELRVVDEAFADSSLFGQDWLPAIGGTDKFNEFEKDYRENVDENATDADLMERWQKDNGAWYSNLGTQIKLGALRGASDTIGAYYGLKRLAGAEDSTTVARAEAAGTLSQDLATATKATGGATLASDAASMIYSSLATAPAGLAGRGVVAAGRAATGVASRVAAAATAGRIGAGAFAKAATLKAGSAAGASLAARQEAGKIIARQLAASTGGGLAASSYAAGLQSAGGAFNQYFDQFLKEELSGIPEEGRTPEVVEAARRRARDGARARAIVSGLVTGAITAGFGATGAQKLAAPQVSQAAQAAKAGMFAFLAKSLGKEALSEASEEGLDELVNGIVDKAAIDPSKPISEIVSDTMKAAVAGGLLGAGMSAPFAIADAYEARKQAKADPAIQARLNAADALGNAGATVSAGVLRQQTEAEIQANLDRQAEEATKTAEVALDEQQPVYRQATELAREVQGQLETLPPDDPQRDVLQQRLDELRLAASENPDAMVRVLDTEVGAAATVEAADPFSAPGEAPPQVAATPTTESPAAQPAEPTDATVGPQPTPGGVGTPPAPTPAPAPAPAALPPTAPSRFTTQNSYLDQEQQARRNAAFAATKIPDAPQKHQDVEAAQASLEPLRQGVTIRGKQVNLVPWGTGGKENMLAAGGRSSVRLEVDGVPVVFYQSTGLGKKDLQRGVWYPTTGLSDTGFLNKETGVEMSEYYGSPILAQIGAMLDAATGNTVPIYDALVDADNSGKSVGGFGPSPEVLEFMGTGVPIAEDADGGQPALFAFREGVNAMLAKLGEPPYYAREAKRNVLRHPGRTKADETPVAAPTPMSPAPKAPKKPAPTQTNDTETKEPPASSVPPVTGQPPVQAPEGQTETGAAPRAGQGKPAKSARPTVADKESAAALVARLSGLEAAPAPAAAEPTPAPAVAPTQQEQNLAAVEKLIIEEMLSSGVIPSKATINTRFKAELGKGLDNGSAELVNIVNRVNDAWKKAHPPEGGTPDGNLYGATTGRDMKKVEADTSEEVIRNTGGRVPFKLVNGVEVGFFTNDPVITAKQIGNGLKVTVPPNLRGKVAADINFDAVTGEVISAYDRSRGAMDPPAISAKGEWYSFYKSSPKTQTRVEALSKRGLDLIAEGKTVESLADELTTATNLVNAVLSGARKMTNEGLEKIVEQKAELLRDFMAVFNIQSPRVPLIGTPAYQAAYAPDTVPGDNELLKAYLNIGGTAKTMTMVEAAVDSAISAGGKFPWLGYHARDLVPNMEGAVINAALVEVRRKLLANPDVTDPATLLPKLQPFNVLVSDTLKYFSDKAKTNQSLVTTSLNEEPNDADRVIAGVSMATAKIDAEAQAAALSKAEAASVPLTEQELASLRRIALNLDNEEKGPSYVNLKDRPLQARQAIDADLKKLPFKVGVNGLILFEYGPELKSDEKKALVTVFPGDTTEAAETRDKHSRMPDLARFFIAATALGRRALANVKNEFGKTMFPAEELSKMSAEAIFKALNTNGGAVATIVDEAKKNIGSFADTGSKTSRELNELIGGMLSSGKPPTAVRSTVTVTGADLAKQRKQEDVATKQVVSETAPGLVGTILQQLNQLADKAKSLSEKIDELEGAVSSFEGKPSDLSELKERLKKAKSSLASNTRATADTNAALREARTNLVTAQNNYNAVAKKNPPTTEQVVKARAEVAEAVQKVTEESVNNRISQGSPAPTISVSAGLAMTPETPQPSNTPEERAEFRNQLIAIGVGTSPDLNGVIKALNLLATRGGTGSPHFKALALMFTNKGSLLNGINSVQLIEEVALAEDVSVNNGTLTFNLSAMTPTLDGTPRGPEALLRGLITHAAKTLTDPAAVLATDQRAALESLEALRREVKDIVEPGSRAAGLSPRFTSALTDVPSFIEAMLTSPEFAEMLQTYKSSIKAPSLTSLWSKFWLAVGQLLTGKGVAKGSALHVGLMNAGKLMVNSPNKGKRFLDGLRAIIDNPEVAFPKSRTPDATEIVHQQDVNEAVELANAPTTLDKVEDRLNGDDSEAADPKGRLTGPPTAGRVTFVPRVAPQPPVGSETLTEQQAFAGLADAIRTVDLVDKVARGVLSADEAGSSVMPSAIQAALDKITTAIERLKGSPATNKDQFIALLEDMQAFLQLEQEQIVAPPAKFDDMSSLVQDIEVEALPPESEIPLAEVAEDEVPFAEPYIETEVEDGSKQPLDFGPFLRSATVKTGRRVAMVDAGPGIPEQPLYVRHDRSDTTIYMNKSAMTDLVEKLRASGYSIKDMTAYLNALLDREASTLTILQRFSDGELVATARSLDHKQRRKILRRVHGLKSGDPDFMRYFSMGNSGSSQDVTADMIQLGADYYRMMRQVSETGHTTEDMMDTIATSRGTLVRTVAFLKATANQFATWWRAYGDVAATRAILNIDSFIEAVAPDLAPTPASKAPKLPKHEVVKVVANLQGKTIDEVLADAKQVSRIREDMRRQVLNGETPETTQLTSQELESFAKDTLGLVEGDGSSVASALATIADLPGVNPATRAVAKELSQNPDVQQLANLLFFVGNKTDSSKARPSGFYNSASHALALNLPEISTEFAQNKESTMWSKAWLVEVLVHEATHAATTIAIYRHEQGVAQPPKVESAIKELRSLYDAVKIQNGADKFAYELSNLDEFAAAVMANPRFVSWLSGVPASVGAQIPGSKGKRSLIKRILSRIYQIVFPDLEIDSVMEKSLSRIFDIASYPHVVTKPSTKAFGGVGIYQSQSDLLGRGILFEEELYEAERLFQYDAEGVDLQDAADEYIDEQDEIESAADEIAAYEAKVSSGTYYAQAPLTQQDRDYLELAKDPEKNRDELQRIIDEAAQAAGYNVGPVYHGTENPDKFTEFRDSPEGAGTYDRTLKFFSDSEDIAEFAYGGTFGHVKRVFLRMKNPAKLADPRELSRRNGAPGLSADFDGAIIPPTRKLPEDPMAQITAMGGNREAERFGTVYAVRSPSQIKLADPITYDAAGNPIPPSQRFQPTSPDIRFAPAPMLPGAVTGERKKTEALKNSLPAMTPQVRDYLKESTYLSETKAGNLDLVESLIGKSIAGATSAVEFEAINSRISGLGVTESQRFLARVVLLAAIDKRILDLREAMAKSPTSGGLSLLADYEGVAKGIGREVQNIISGSAQVVNAGNIARDILNPKFATATYRDSATDMAETKLPEDAKALLPELQKEADDVAAEVVKKSKLTKKIVDAMAKASGGDPTEVQMMFDFMTTLENYLDESTGVPIPAKMADWVADQMLKMVDSKLKAEVKKAADKIKKASTSGSDTEATFFEEYSDEVKRLVAERINQALAAKPATPEMTEAQKEQAKKEALRAAIGDLRSFLEYAPSVERALNQSKAKLLARLEAEKGSTPEALKLYEDAKAAIGAMSVDFVPMKKATDIVRRSFDMREQIYLSITEQQANVASLAAMITNATGLTADQSRKVAEAFKAAYEAEMNRRVQKTLTNYATRRSARDLRGKDDRYTRSERFLRLARLGGLRKEEFYNAMATEFDLPSYDPAIADELDREANRIMGMPKGSVQRNDAMQELNARIVNETYKNLLAAYGPKAIVKDAGMRAEYFAAIPVAMWKSAVLSGFGTAEVNFAFGTMQSIMDLGFNASAYAIKAKDPAFAASSLITLMRAVGWVADPAQRKEVWTEMKRAALTGRTRFGSEQSENMLVLERDIPAIDVPVIKQLMGSTKRFYKLMGRIGSVIDAAVAVPASIARQRLALHYALTTSGADQQKIAEIMSKSFSLEELESREINEILESEKEQFRNSPRPDLAMQARRFQLMEQRRAETYEQLTATLDTKDKEDFLAASRESSRFANLGTPPTGLAGLIFDGVFGTIERKTKGASSVVVSFPRAMGNILDFSLAMSFPLLSFARAKNKSPSSWFFDEDNRYRREFVEKDSIQYWKLMTQGIVAAVAQLTMGALYMYGLEDEAEGRVPWFMVYGKGYDDPERNRQLRYRQPRWAPYTLKVGDLYLSWKDLPGFNLLLGGLAAITDDQMKKGLKDVEKIRGWEAAANTTVAFLKAVTVKSSLQGLAQAGEILSDNSFAEASAADNIGKLVTGFVGGGTNPRLLRDVTNIGRGIVSGGEYTLKDTRGISAAVLSMLPGNELYGESLGQRDMLNSMGTPVTNFWSAPFTKRLLPLTAGPAVDPIMSPLVSSGLFISPIKSGQMSFSTYKTGSDEVDVGGGLLSSFGPEVEADAVKMFGEQMRLRITPEYVEELTTLADKGQAERELAQKALNKVSESARGYVKDVIQARIFDRELVPHWQEK
jgi:hypothetical protein